jgi:hypothetical protein
MPSASEFSTDPNANTTIGGANVAEDCPPGGLNNAIRYIAAVVRDTYNNIPVLSNLMPISGGTFTGDIARSGRGAYLHHGSAGSTDGRVIFLPEGSARPAGAEGMIVFYYS